ncbi:MAG: hypothetical protein GAK29_01425 [Acinetobacter bereziniae]|uniref:Uncharacterized protein n=1 Tax=Acinetobacter bereziniae TaxID=106648 RepID=A0A833PFC4_ACIBZ|nr:MAG: hypothetical protein GAK29_01425 [Acinetobacter bereziniae]
MEDLKIKIDSNLDELIELFCQLGFKYFNHTCSVKNYLICESGKVFFCKFDKNFKASNAKEITIEQLKDMVILNRNDSNNANVHQEGDIPCLYNLYLTNDKELYFYHCGKKKWILSNLNHDEDYYRLLKPIQADKVEVEDSKIDTDKMIADVEVQMATYSQHSHYFKDVRDLNVIDVYQVLKLFNVNDPCLQHIVKKALVAGGRGHKDLERDLKDIHDTSKRALEINNILH